MTAALQLLAHLDGEALHVALLMPEKVRERWKDLVDGLSEYYNSPGRLAVFRRRFDNACRRPGRSGYLCHRTGDPGNKFIAAQPSCELQRYLDGAVEDASIGDIVDSCRSWESHMEAGYVRSDRQDPDGSQSVSQVTVLDKSHLTTAKSAPLQQDVGHVVPTPIGSPPRVTHSSADRELLIQSILEMIQSRRIIIPQRSQVRELEFMLRDMLPVGCFTQSGE